MQKAKINRSVNNFKLLGVIAMSRIINAIMMHPKFSVLIRKYLAINHSMTAMTFCCIHSRFVAVLASIIIKSFENSELFKLMEIFNIGHV